ncbi:collectin-10-like [Lethenteron reissneri]|uniref:collectin-10-like n=1 Tax=Lethenteron reissneri TaxID=7753 RepID=UPI002AB6DE24|nr:collectin-10-like [Lethenteron reissneri]
MTMAILVRLAAAILFGFVAATGALSSVGPLEKANKKLCSDKYIVVPTITGVAGEKGDQGIPGIPGVQGPPGPPGAPCNCNFNAQFASLQSQIDSLKGTRQHLPKNKIYRLFTNRSNYHSARQQCANHGGVLAMPKNAIQNARIQQVVRGDRAFIGLNDIQLENNFVFSDGSRFLRQDTVQVPYHTVMQLVKMLSTVPL